MISIFQAPHKCNYVDTRHVCIFQGTEKGEGDPSDRMEGGGSLSSILSSDGTDSVGFLPSNTGSVGFLPSNGGASSVRSNDRAYRYNDETLSDEATSTVLTSLEAAEEAYSRTHSQGKSG